MEGQQSNTIGQLTKGKDGQPAASKGSPQDSIQVMLLKNEKIREDHSKLIKQLHTEEQKTVVEMERQIKDVKNEIRDMNAYNIVYRANSLYYKDLERKKQQQLKPVVLEPLNEPPTNYISTPQANTLPEIKREASVTPSGKRTPQLKKQKKDTSKDPFRLKECLQDIHNDLDEKDTKPKPGPVLSTAAVQMRRRVRQRASKTAPPPSNYESVMPGKCTTYYSIRKFYDQEKDKIIMQWSPEEKRKRAVKWVIENLKLPTFSLMRKQTTSAIYRDFNKFRRRGNITWEDEIPGAQNKKSNNLVSQQNKSITVKVPTQKRESVHSAVSL